MDLGVFRRSRIGLWLWVSLPLLVVLLVFAISRRYCRGLERELLHRTEVAKLMPAMHRQHQAARRTVDAFGARVSDETDAVRELRNRLNDIALECGVVINSLSVEAPPGGMAGSVPCFRADVTGEGEMESLIGLFEKLQTPTGLVSVASLRMGVSMAGAKPLYRTEFVLRWSFLSK